MLLTLLFTLAFAMYNLTLPLIAGIYIVSDLGGSPFIGPYGVAFFALGTVLGVPLGKGLKNVSPQQFFNGCLICMSIISLGVGSASNFVSFVLFRLLEGIVCGPLFLIITITLMPVAVNKQKTVASSNVFGRIRAYFLREIKNEHFLLAIILTCFSSAPMIGACMGDWFAFYLNWRLLFILNVPICLVILIIMQPTFAHVPPVFREIHSDWTGYFFYFISFLFLGSALIIGQEFDWFRSFWISFLINAGIVSLCLYIVVSWGKKNATVVLSLFKNIYFILGAVSLCLLFSLYFGSVVLISLWLKLYVNYTAEWIVLLTSLLILGIWIPLFLHYEMFDPRLPLLISLLFLIASSFYCATFNIEINFNRIAFSRALAGLAIPIFLPPLFRLAVLTFPQSEQLAAANVFHISRLFGAVLGAGSFIIIWQRRQAFYHDRLGSQLTDFSTLTQQFFERAQQFHLTQKQAFAQLQYFLDRKATALALDDCFYLMGWICVVMLIAWLGTFLLSPLARSSDLSIHAKHNSTN